MAWRLKCLGTGLDRSDPLFFISSKCSRKRSPRVYFFGKIQDWIFQLDYKDSFLRKNEKSKKGFFRVIFLNPRTVRASLQAKSKMVATLFMFFNEVSNDDFQI